MYSLHLLLGLATFFIPKPSTIAGLPKGALIVEQRTLAAKGYANRSLVLWMLNPTREQSTYSPDDPYTCPQETRGTAYSGPTRLSLVDTARNRIINTVKIPDAHSDDQDSFDLPYRILSGFYYHTVSKSKRREVKPIILWLKDYNGDGKALEFALFDAPACMGLQTALFGYVPETDRVIHYPIHLKINDEGKTSSETLFWVDYLFSKNPQTTGHWKYEIDYRGRGGTLDQFDIRYDRRLRLFRGSVIQTR